MNWLVVEYGSVRMPKILKTSQLIEFSQTQVFCMGCRSTNGRRPFFLSEFKNENLYINKDIFITQPVQSSYPLPLIDDNFIFHVCCMTAKSRSKYAERLVHFTPETSSEDAKGVYRDLQDFASDEILLHCTGNFTRNFHDFL